MPPPRSPCTAFAVITTKSAPPRQPKKVCSGRTDIICLARFITSQSTICQSCWDASSWVETVLAEDKSTKIDNGHCSIIQVKHNYNLIKFYWLIRNTLTDSADQDQMQQNEASDQGLH